MPDVLASVASLAFIDGIGFDPFFRGLLSVLAAVVVLIGSTYLILATNTGVRHGFLVAAAGLFGWMFLMGIIWTVYGIGWAGQAPTWSLIEINVDDPEDNDDGLLFSEVGDATILTASGSDVGLPSAGLASAPVLTEQILERFEEGEARDRAAELLAGASVVDDIEDPDLAQEAALVASRELQIDEWLYLITSNPIRGDAQASADAFLVEETGFDATSDYVAVQFGAFLLPGKPVLQENPSMIDRVAQKFNETVLNPTFDRELIVLQVQAVVPQPTLPGQPPPIPEADPNAPLVSVIMERDRGGPFPALFSGLRFTPAMFTIVNGLIFAAFAWNMHLRDRRESEIRAAAT